LAHKKVNVYAQAQKHRKNKTNTNMTTSACQQCKYDNYRPTMKLHNYKTTIH